MPIQLVKKVWFPKFLVQPDLLSNPSRLPKLCQKVSSGCPLSRGHDDLVWILYGGTDLAKIKIKLGKTSSQEIQLRII